MKFKCIHKYTRNIISNNTTHYALKRCTDCGKFISWVPKNSVISIDMDVPFSEKTEAKAAGAFWDPHAVTWYAPNMKKTKNLRKWIEDSEVSRIYEQIEKYNKSRMIKS